ncbi:MAG: hypothetical protein KJ621_03520 [Proteobacteria bacterium]|nr:hypothetical protein [Pseudomonadota bacterium]MBU1741116.1 hypothetical protein [Pseudomonadota bacterium]
MRERNPARWSLAAVAAILVVAGAAGLLTVYTHVRYGSSPLGCLVRLTSPARPRAVLPPRVINLDKPPEQIRLDRTQSADRKRYGLVKSVKIVARPKDTIQAGSYRFKMAKVLDLINRQRLEEGLPRLDERAVFGLRRVRAGDNLWNIHKSVLADLLGKFDLRLTEASDRPGTGVGRILLYAQKRVYLYNLQTQHLFVVKRSRAGVPWLTPAVQKIVKRDLNKLYPDQDVIVFNLNDLEPLRQWLLKVRASRGRVTLDDLDRIWLDTGRNQLVLPPRPRGRVFIRHRIVGPAGPKTAPRTLPDQDSGPAPWSAALKALTR